MTDDRLLDHAADGIDAAAATSWAVIDAMYSDALTGVAAIAVAAEQTIAARATTDRAPREWSALDRLPVPRAALDAVSPIAVSPLADVVRVGGLTLGRSMSRHAAADTGVLPRQVA